MLDVWHRIAEFKNVFNSFCELSDVNAKVEFSFEWKRKYEIFDMLKNERIPRNCYFSCEMTNTKKPCGKCHKCKEIKIANYEMELYKNEVTD